MKRPIFLCLSVLFLHATFLHSQDLDTVMGGYTSCHIYEYTYKSGVPDISSKKETTSYKYNSSGKMTEKQCVEKPCGEIFEGMYFNNVLIEKYEYDDMGNITEEKYYDEGSGLLIKITRKFDSMGNIIEELLFESATIVVKTLKKYDTTGNVLDETKYKGKDYEQRTWTYDAKGKEIEQTHYYNTNTDTFKFTTKRDEYGNAVEYRSTADYNPVSYTFYKYDKDGKILEAAYSGSTDYEKHSYQYDTIGRVIFREIYNQNSWLTSSKTNIEYDTAGSRTEVTTTANSYYAKSIDKYNSNDQITEDASYNREGALISKTLYTYDAYSNPVGIIEYNESEAPVSKTEYVYSK